MLLVHANSFKAEYYIPFIEDSNHDPFAQNCRQCTDTKINFSSPVKQFDPSILRETMLCNIHLRHDFGLSEVSNACEREQNSQPDGANENYWNDDGRTEKPAQQSSKETGTRFHVRDDAGFAEITISCAGIIWWIAYWHEIEVSSVLYGKELLARSLASQILRSILPAVLSTFSLTGSTAFVNVAALTGHFDAARPV
jgi:hypothetical protein